MSALKRQWLWPIALAIATVFGLLSALVGEAGIWPKLSWLTLSLPLATIAICLARPLCNRQTTPSAASSTQHPGSSKPR